MRSPTLINKVIFSSYWVWLPTYVAVLTLAAIYCTLVAAIQYISCKIGHNPLDLTLVESLKKEFRGASDAIVWPDKRCFEMAKKRKLDNA